MASDDIIVTGSFEGLFYSVDGGYSFSYGDRGGIPLDKFNSQDVAYGKETFLTIPFGGPTYYLVSDNGVNWSSRPWQDANGDPLPDWNPGQVVYGPKGFVAIGSGVAYKSVDAITWEPVGVASTGSVHQVSQANGMYYLQFGLGHRVVSSDLVTWFPISSATLPSQSSIRMIFYEAGKYVTLDTGSSSTEYMGQSLDGANYTYLSRHSSIGVQRGLLSLGGRYIVYGDRTVYNDPLVGIIISSGLSLSVDDMLTWTHISRPNNHSITDGLVYDDHFVFAGNHVVGTDKLPLIQTSPDGENFTPSSIEAPFSLSRAMECIASGPGGSSGWIIGSVT